MISKLFALLTVVTISVVVSAQSFSPEYFAYPNPLSVVQGDLNGDSIPDFISEISGPNELLSSGSGHFAPRIVSHSGYYPIATGDFNRDGKTDTIFLNSLVVGYGDGHGGFSSFQTIPWTNGNQAFVEVRAQVADFNGDGRPDLAIAFDTYGSSQSFQIVLFTNNGNGFNDGVTIYDRPIPPGANPGFEYTTDLDFVLGDFDSDGHADLAFRTTESDPNNPATSVLTLIVFYGNRNGTFTPQTVLTTNTQLFEIAAADMNNDGTTDIVANGQSVTIFYAQRNRTFTSTTLTAAGDIAITPMLADFDGNGLKDVIYPAYNPTPGDNTIGVNALLQTSVGKFVQGKYVTFDSFNSGPGQVPFGQTFVGDYNRDGKPDVALVAFSESNHPQSLDVLLNTLSGANGSCQAPAPVGIHICSPTSNATVQNPVSFAFSATSFYPVRKMEVWIDGVKRSETYEVFANEGFSNVKLTLTPGSHRVALFSGGFDGTVQHVTYYITVK